MSRWDINRMDVRKMHCEDENWTGLAQIMIYS